MAGQYQIRAMQDRKVYSSRMLNVVDLTFVDPHC